MLLLAALLACAAPVVAAAARRSAAASGEAGTHAAPVAIAAPPTATAAMAATAVPGSAQVAVPGSAPPSEPGDGSTERSSAGGPAGDANVDTASRCPPPPQPPDAATAQALAAQASDHGFLWRIRKHGRSSYLYGTLHVGRLAWDFPGPALRAAWAATDTLALELDLTDERTQAQLQQAIARAPHVTLPAPLAQRLARLVAQACVPPHTLDAMPPALQAATLEAVAGRADGLEPAYAQENALAALAQAGGRRIVGLETVGEQLDALLPPDRAETIASVEAAIAPLEHGDGGRETLRRLVAIWRDSDLRALQHYPTWCDCMNSAADRRAMHRLIDERNVHLAARIDALHVQGHAVLAAVGALHMVGPHGLPRLLAARGYVVEQLLPSR
jgi:hypothetical protein